MDLLEMVGQAGVVVAKVFAVGHVTLVTGEAMGLLMATQIWLHHKPGKYKQHGCNRMDTVRFMK